MLSLPDITLCAVTSINHELTVRAMVKCLRDCSFADVVLLSDRPVAAPFRVEIIPHFEGEGYAPVVCRELTHHTASAFNLLVQYDSYILDPSAWTDRFLDYDYIGPKWPWHIADRRVGNSGFCLRSKKLLDVCAEIPLPPTGSFVDDKWICVTMREVFETQYGIKIAPEDIADRFAFERHEPALPTFGFHGIFNFWRTTDDAEMIEVIGLLAEPYLYARSFAEILFRYYDARKFPVLHAAYKRLRSLLGLEAVRGHLGRYLGDAAFIDRLMVCGEGLLRHYGQETAA